MDLTNHLVDLVARSQGPTGFLLLAFCAFIEYVFPPFPGDIVVVFGAFLVARRGWPATAVFGSVTAGSVAGFMMAYSAGRWLRRAESHWIQGRLARARPTIDRLVERFSRHGSWYLAINRFLPSVRALFFVAAGMVPLPPWKVLVFGLVSALVWNALLFALGATAGWQWSRLQQIFLTYGTVAWIVVAVVGGAWLLRWWWRRRRLNGR
jgi:membrane protein DedA with SNARE-associated domain